MFDYLPVLQVNILTMHSIWYIGILVYNKMI